MELWFHFNETKYLSQIKWRKIQVEINEMKSERASDDTKPWTQRLTSQSNTKGEKRDNHLVREPHPERSFWGEKTIRRTTTQNSTNPNSAFFATCLVLAIRQFKLKLKKVLRVNRDKKVGKTWKKRIIRKWYDEIIEGELTPSVGIISGV